MIGPEDVERAHDRIAAHVRETPLWPSSAPSTSTGAAVRLKLECLQRTGSFKVRGATNRIAALADDERRAGVVAASGGNHAQGVALAARRVGVDATIVMPVATSPGKVRATRELGARVVLHGGDYNEAAAHARELEARDGLTFVHAFEDPLVVAGQGTVGLEVRRALEAVDLVVVPIGGGGLIGGIAAAFADAPTRVVGVQAAGATSASRSIEAGRVVELDAVDTVAEGMATRHVGELPLALMEAHVDAVVTVSDDDLEAAIRHLLATDRVLAEHAGAAAVAGLLTGAVDVDDAESVVPVVSGGNLDLAELRAILPEA
ncbi:MAG: threonine/serine dehydratase [Halobacteriales archaeon]